MSTHPRPPWRRALVLGTALSLAAALAACGGDDDTSSSGGGGGGGGGDGLVIAIADEPSTLDPQATEDGNERAVNDNVYEALLARDGETNELVPRLATELPTQVEPTVWEFTIREGVEFTNGEPFDAEAAAFSINRIVDPDYESAQLDYYGPLEGAEAVDATTLRVTTSAPDLVLPSRLARLKMVPPEASQEASFTEEPVGTGPYVVTRWERGQQVTLEANEDYWGDAPPEADVTIRFISEAGTRVAGLRTGEIDLATLLPPEQAADAPQVLTEEGVEFPVYRLKNYDGTLVSQEIRQALNYAVDKEAIAEDLFSGYATVADCQPSQEGTTGYNPDLEPYPYDPDRARELLEEAGYDGEPLTLLGATGRWLKDAEMHEVVIGYLQEVGVSVTPDIRPFSSYIDEFTRTVGDAQPDMGFVSASNELFDASKMDSYYASDGSLSSYVNDEADALIAEATAAETEEERETAYQELFALGCEDPPFIFTVNLQDIYGAAEGLEWTPRTDGSLYIPEMSLGS